MENAIFMIRHLPAVGHADAFDALPDTSYARLAIVQRPKPIVPTNPVASNEALSLFNNRSASERHSQNL